MRNILYLEPSTFSDPANLVSNSPPPTVIVPPPPPPVSVYVWVTAIVQNGKLFAVTVRASDVLDVDIDVSYHLTYTNPADHLTYEFDGSLVLPKNTTIKSGTYLIPFGGYGYGKLQGGVPVGAYAKFANPNPAGGTSLTFVDPNI